MSDVYRFDDTVPVVAGRRYPWALVDIGDYPAGDIVFRRRRFRLPFENRWQLSVVWGSGSYSANHDAWHDGDVFVEESPTAELAVYFDDAGDERMVSLWPDGDSVTGYVPAVVVRDLIVPTMAGWPSDMAAVLACQPVFGPTFPEPD